MKRPGDDFYVRPQVKRPLGLASTRTESYVQSQVGGGEGTSQRLTTNNALTYLKDVKDIFQDQKEKYDQFLEVMKDFKSQKTNTAGVIQRVKELFKGHNNLILGFNNFLPKGYEITLEEKKAVEFDEAIGFVNKIKRRFQHDEHVYKSFLDILNMYRKEHKGITEVYHEVTILFDDHPDLLDEFTRFLPDKSAAPNNRRSLLFYDERSSAVPIIMKYPVNKHYQREKRYCDRDLSVDRPDLEADKASMKILREHRNDAEKDASEKRYCDHNDREIDQDRKLARRSEDSKSIKADEIEKALKYETDTSKDTNRHKEKYLAKSIQELDLSNCLRCTPSYRRLPEDYSILRASQRSELGAQVLNDHWVSVTSGSEDYSFKHMRRNQYEESLFICEDDRFELDMLLESASSAFRSAEELLNKLNDGALDVVIPLRLEEHFSALNLRCIERLYGDHGLDAVNILRKTPFTALPVILTRLQQKKEEWARCRTDFNKVWADIYSKNHYKSLDHRSFYFKQQDSKNLSTKSLVYEIKEVKETKQKECDILMTVAAGNRRPITPSLEFQYPDAEIHGNLYELVQYSCKEICSTKEQSSKVLRLWTTFLEPMLGIPARIESGDSVEAIAINGHKDVNVGSCLGNSVNVNGSVTDDPPPRTTWTLNPSSTGNENTSPETIVVHGNILNKESVCLNTVKSKSARDNSVSKNPGSGVQVASDLQCTNSAVQLTVAIEISHDKMCIDTPASSRDINVGTKIGDNRKSISGGSLIEDGSDEKVDKLTNGETADDPNRHGNHGLIGESSIIEKEEGELSPAGDSQDDVPPSPLEVEDHDVKSPIYDVGEAICSQNPVEENDADDEDSENISIACEVSGSESAGDGCSREDHDEEDEEEHEEVDGKVESEGEAEGLQDTNSAGGDGTLPNLSECILLNVKPLAKYISLEWHDEGNKDTRVFYGNDNYYVLLRLHQMLYERILFAKTNTVAAEARQRPLTGDANLEPFKRFLKALYSLLDGSANNSKFEDECRSLIGNHSYVLFTLDKLIYKLIKQLQSVASDETDIKLLQLYEYEKSRKCENRVNSVYHENARILLQEDNIYRFEFISSPSSLSMQLMDSEGVKPEIPAVSIDPNFGDYLYNDFLADIPSKQEPSCVLLQRNKRLIYNKLYESSAKDMEFVDNVKMVNGLEYKIVCNSSKISYVLDTEDYLFRSKRQMKNMSAKKSLKINQTRKERFHMLLHIFNSN